MQQKKCFRCSRVLSLDQFYKHPGMADGHLGKCKDCARRDVSENRKKRIEKYRAYDIERGKSPERVALSTRVTKEFRARHQDRYRAQTAVNNAIRDGRLVKQPCEFCGRLDVHGHHDDYAKPLEVRWLCPAHHKEHHERNRPG